MKKSALIACISFVAGLGVNSTVWTGEPFTEVVAQSSNVGEGAADVFRRAGSGYCHKALNLAA